MRGPVLALALLIALWPTHAGAALSEDATQVTVRIECGASEHEACEHGPLWHGTVTLDGDYELDTGGETHTLDEVTPLGALHAAAEKADLSLTIDAQFEGSDFTVEAIDGVWEQGTHWWKHRVNLVETYYGPQHGWKNAEPELQDGDEVLWYLGHFETRPLRMTTTHVQPQTPTGDTDPAVAPCQTAAALLVEWPVLDVRHRAGNPWPPPQAWIPAHDAEIHGDAHAPAPAGATAVLLGPGTHTLWASADATTHPTDPVASAPTPLTVEECP